MKKWFGSMAFAILSFSLALGGGYRIANTQGAEQTKVKEETPAIEVAKEKPEKPRDGKRCLCENPSIQVFVAGVQDNFSTANGPELTSPRPALQAFLNTYNNGQFPKREFDDGNSNRVFGHTFYSLPITIIAASLEIHLKAVLDIPSNDTINLDLNYLGNAFSWGRSLKDLPGAGGTWNNGQEIVVTLDLAALPLPNNQTISILTSLNADRALDVYVQDDTAVDYIRLVIVTCPGRWTDWLDRDDPSGKGDYETLTDFISSGTLPATPAPDGMECQTLGGADYSTTGEVYVCNALVGGYCENAAQPDGACMDYKVRFHYPQ